MGISIKSLEFLNDSINKCGLSLKGCRMVELGNQELKEGFELYNKKIAKKYFQSIGVDHISIDINKKDGALPINLNEEIEDQFLIGTFDILTNFGTTEHVIEQYMCWDNIHNLVKEKGIFVHIVPRKGNWKMHGYFKYSIEFFKTLSRKMEYSIIDISIMKSNNLKDLICCSMIKNKNNDFIPIELFEALEIDKDLKMFEKLKLKEMRDK